MRYTVKIDGQTFVVEVGDLGARPIIAAIGREQFEVWPETETVRPAAAAPNGQTGPGAGQAVSPPPPSAPLQRSPAAGAATGSPAKAVRAPIPGVISSIAVQAGESVTVGQPLCVLDAMKMSNTIRAPRAGTIAAVAAVVGQPVKHNDVLFEFVD